MRRHGNAADAGQRNERGDDETSNKLPEAQRPATSAARWPRLRPAARLYNGNNRVAGRRRER
jgi:hypothetical protein